MRLTTIILRWFFVVLLTASAIGKLADMPGFYGVVSSYALLPDWAIPASAWALALVELALAIWLATGRHLVEASWIVIALHGVYLTWLSITLARGLDIPNCGCFGTYWARPLSVWTPFEDLVLLLMALAMWRVQRRQQP